MGTTRVLTSREWMGIAIAVMIFIVIPSLLIYNMLGGPLYLF